MTAAQLASQIKAADALRAELMRSGAAIAAANTRLERLSAQSNTLLSSLSSARAAQTRAETEAAAQNARLVELGGQVKSTFDLLGGLASASYMRGGALGDYAAILEALTSPSPDQNTDSLATARYLVDGRGRLLSRLRSLQSEQVRQSAAAQAAHTRTAAAARLAAQAKLDLDVVIVAQRTALERFEAVQVGQVAKAADLQRDLLRSKATMAREADERLAKRIQAKNLLLLMESPSTCGTDLAAYPNGMIPPRALCPLYGSPEESLPRAAAIAFNAMSKAYEEQTGSALCVTEGYRPYAEQVAVRLAKPKLAATPGKSQHGFGMAVDLCGGVENFAHPAHLWMQRSGPLYGWFHPAWAEPLGGMPEPWHWEFAS